jgi:hypothetical protein
MATSAAWGRRRAQPRVDKEAGSSGKAERGWRLGPFPLHTLPVFEFNVTRFYLTHASYAEVQHNMQDDSSDPISEYPRRPSTWPKLTIE